ncbi:hypothetical protein BJX70DRAFT_355254 [Aspergillus crustosus]
MDRNLARLTRLHRSDIAFYFYGTKSFRVGYLLAILFTVYSQITRETTVRDHFGLIQAP